MKRSVAVESASSLIDAKIKELGDWRGKTLARSSPAFNPAMLQMACVERTLDHEETAAQRVHATDRGYQRSSPEDTQYSGGHAALLPPPCDRAGLCTV